MKVDYIVVGSGLAGIALCKFLSDRDKSFVVIDDNSQQSSTVAGGLYNPVVLKRFTKVWKAKEQLLTAMPYYDELAKLLDIQLDHRIPIYRLFASIEEQNNWFQAADKKALSEFMDSNLIQLDKEAIHANFGFGKVLQTGRINTSLLVISYKKYLKDNNRLIESAFEYSELEIHDSKVAYKNIEAERIVFAEGFGITKNPFFKNLPLNGTKGELITIHAPDLKIDFILKSSVFLIPLGSDLYRVGATYERKDKSNTPSKQGKEELVKKLNKVINCPYEIVDQVAGIRPTVADRRPLIGQHEKYAPLYILNGLGSRGVMISPYVANALLNYIENGIALDPEIDIKRFSS